MLRTLGPESNLCARMPTAFGLAVLAHCVNYCRFTAKWYEGEHRYIDPDKRYIFAFVANSLSGQVAYNLNQANPGEFKTYWDLLQPKWKGKTVSLDPTAFGMGATLQFSYYYPDLGRPFIKKLYGDMQITVSRDPRQ